MNAADRQRLAERQDTERRRLETAALLALLLVTDETRRHALAAWKLGRDPVADAVATINGGANVRGLADRLAPLMLAGWQLGVNRTLMNANAAGVGGIGAVADIARDDGGTLVQQFYRDATAAVTLIADRIRQRLYDAFATTAPQNATQAANLIRVALVTEGFTRPTQDTPTAAFGLQRLTDTLIGEQYLAARAASLSDVRIAQLLYGFEFHAVRDEKTTIICKTCDGTILPPWDPWWQTHWPLMHFNCRSQVVEIWQTPGVTRVPEFTDPAPTIQAMPGFGVMPVSFVQRAA